MGFLVVPKPKKWPWLNNTNALLCTKVWPNKHKNSDIIKERVNVFMRYHCRYIAIVGISLAFTGSIIPLL